MAHICTLQDIEISRPRELTDVFKFCADELMFVEEPAPNSGKKKNNKIQVVDLELSVSQLGRRS